MKTIEELKNYYDTNLKSNLEILENKRKQVASKIITINTFCGLGLGISIILFFFTNFFTLITAIPIVIIWIILCNKSIKGYTSNFKTEVIEKIIKFIDKNLDYYPTRFISMETYMSSKIFRTTPDRYKGDDFVTGKIDKTDLMFSEIHSLYKTETQNNNGTRQTNWNTIFKGLFFSATFNKKFKGETYVLPDVAQSIFGKLVGNMFQSWNKMRGQLIKMEDVEFEKLFVVYGSDQIEARYILSTSLMKRIVDFKKSKKKQIYLSFIDNKIFVAISYAKNLFEPKVFKTLLNFNIIHEYYDDLQIAISIVEELNLNKRIWG